MPRKNMGLEKISVRLFLGQKDELDRLFPKLGHTQVIRQLVTQCIKNANAKAQDVLDEIVPQQKRIA